MTDVPARLADAPKMLALDELTPEQEEAIIKGVNIDRLKREMDRRITAQSEDFQALVADFLSTRRSVQTARRYRNSIRIWERWCAQAGIQHPLLAEPKDADLFAAQIPGAPATVNSTISAVSSFYSTMVKWGKVPRTPFVKIARRGEATTEHLIPTAKEVQAIINASSGYLKAAVVAMARRGFRVGALQGIALQGSKFTTTSKGKSWKGEIGPAVKLALRDRGPHPFANVKQGTVQAAFKRVTERLAAAGAIAHAYSVHDLRHHFASREYAKDKDLVRVSKLLNHADVKITTKYLHDLGAI